MSNLTYIRKKCEWCGNRFIPNKRSYGLKTIFYARQKYCGEKCASVSYQYRRKGIYSKPKLFQKKCLVCKKTFKQIRHNQKTCGGKCTIKWFSSYNYIKHLPRRIKQINQNRRIKYSLYHDKYIKKRREYNNRPDVKIRNKKRWEKYKILGYMEKGGKYYRPWKFRSNQSKIKNALKKHARWYIGSHKIPSKQVEWLDLLYFFKKEVENAAS